GRVTRRASSGPGCFLRENALGLASREFSPGKPLPSTAEWPGSGCLQRPQRGLPHVDGPLGGAFLIPRPMAVVGYLPTKSTASGRVTRRASSGPACFLRENALGLASREFSPGKPLPSTAEWPGSGCLQRPQRGLPHVDGPLGGAFLIPR